MSIRKVGSVTGEVLGTEGEPIVKEAHGSGGPAGPWQQPEEDGLARENDQADQDAQRSSR